MGRLSIILVTAMGIFLAQGFASSAETSYQTAVKQVDHEEGTLAREIARTGFNIAMGVLRSHGDDLQAGVEAVNGSQGYISGSYQGGTYRAYARYTSGHSVEVVSTGYYGEGFTRTNNASAYSTTYPCDYYDGACHVMDDVYEYTLPTQPLHVKQRSVLDVTFLDSMAGYCSAIYLEKFDPDGNSLGDPQMVFPAGKNRNGASLTFSDTLDAGTQMNFMLAVDKNCSTGQNWSSFTPQPFNIHDYDHVHYALAGTVGNLLDMEETVWSLIEQHPDDNQRWRIGWEDQHKTSWDNATSTNPANSFQALKAFGYDGNGWPTVDSWGYRTLRDYGSRPDFSDQVIEVRMTPVPTAAPAPPPSTPAPSGPSGPGSPSLPSLPSAPGTPAGGPLPPSTSPAATPTTPSDPPEPSESPEPSEPGTTPAPSTIPTASCPCTEGRKTVYIRHFTNRQNNPYRDICIGPRALSSHLSNHNDFLICRTDGG